MIYDCINFYNEFDLLDIRLNELDPVVDKFVIAESTVTFTNRKKPLYFAQNKSRYEKFLKKIIHVVIDDSPNVVLPWIVENHQLTNVMRGLTSCKPKDTILVSCADEIPKPETIVKWIGRPGRNKAFMQAMSYYYFNCVCTTPWAGTRMFFYKDLKALQGPYIARFSPIDVEIPDGGWHLRFMGGIKEIQRKLASWSHQEFNNDEYNTPEYIAKVISQGEDILKSGFKFKFVKEDFLPKYILDNKENFKGLILDIDKRKEPGKLRLKYLEAKRKARIIARKLLLPIRG